MPESTDAPATDSPEETTGAEETFDPDRAKAKIQKANSEAANLRRRVRELEAAEAKLRELEDATKSDGQRLVDERDQHKTRADKAEAELLRLTVAMNKGLTVAQAKRLVGDSLEELEADADELVATFAPATKKAEEDEDDRPRRPGRPTPATLTGPAGDTDTPGGFDARRLAAELRARRF
jgi:DNA repair exonuclease SbcCD ATPase subunit